jgi:hypothetical protein
MALLPFWSEYHCKFQDQIKEAMSMCQVKDAGLQALGNVNAVQKETLRKSLTHVQDLAERLQAQEGEGAVGRRPVVASSFRSVKAPGRGALATAHASTILQASLTADVAAAEALRLESQLAAARSEVASDEAGLCEARAESARLRAELANTHAALIYTSGARSATRTQAANSSAEKYPWSKEMFLSSEYQDSHAQASSVKLSQVGRSMGDSGDPIWSLSLSELRQHAKHASDELRLVRAQHKADKSELENLRTQNKQLLNLVGSAKEVRAMRGWKNDK